MYYITYNLISPGFVPYVRVFFVGNDNQDINDAFRAAMAYDPALPSSEQEVLVREIIN